MLSFNTNELTNFALKNTKEETAQYSLHVVGLVINHLNKTIICCESKWGINWWIKYGVYIYAIVEAAK